jgi:putative component of toxin-antitoxin plasmid stabilization module
MIEVIQSDAFASWLKGLRDHDAASRVVTRIFRMSLGNLGNC